MITKHDWDDALDAWTAGERERLGGPPAAEEIVAYRNGELSRADAARVRALLVYYPELTPFVRRPRKLAWLRPYAAAATVTVAMLGTVVVQLQHRIAMPAVHSARHELEAFRTRGPGLVHELPAGERRYHIVAVPSEPPDAGEYRLEIVRDSDVLWSARGVRPVDDAFDISIPGEFLEPGTYTLNVYDERHLIERYTLRVVER